VGIAGDNVVAREIVFGECVGENSGRKDGDDEGNYAGYESQSADAPFIFLRTLSVSSHLVFS